MFPSLLIFIYCFAVGGCCVLISVKVYGKRFLFIIISQGCSLFFSSTDDLCCWQTVSFHDTCLLVIKNTVQDCSHATGNLALRWCALICVLKQCSSCGYLVFSRDYQKLKPKSVASYTPDIFVPEWQLPFTNPARHLEVGQLTNPWLVQ